MQYYCVLLTYGVCITTVLSRLLLLHVPYDQQRFVYEKRRGHSSQYMLCVTVRSTKSVVILFDQMRKNISISLFLNRDKVF